MRLRHQLAAYSPVSAMDVIAASAASSQSSLEALRASLVNDYLAEDATLVGSGTHALQLALGSVDRGGRERLLVAAPAFTCFDIATALIGADVDVMLYDIDPATLGPDLDSLSDTLASGAQAVVLSPLYGIPFDWDAAAGAVRDAGAVVIEDAAQGHGATWRGKRFGSLGDISILSFSRGKGWTGGGGGAVLSRGAAKIRSLPVNARAGSRLVTAMALGFQYVFGRPALYGLPRAVPALGLGETVFREPTDVAPMGSLSAAVLRRSRGQAEEEGRIRRANARAIAALLPERIDRYAGFPGAEAGYLRFPVRLSAGMASFPDLSAAEALGIAPSYPLPLHQLPELAAQRPRHARLPGAEELSRCLVTLPTHSRLGGWEIEEIAAQVSAV